MHAVTGSDFRQIAEKLRTVYLRYRVWRQEQFANFPHRWPVASPNTHDSGYARATEGNPAIASTTQYERPRKVSIWPIFTCRRMHSAVERERLRTALRWSEEKQPGQVTWTQESDHAL